MSAELQAKADETTAGDTDKTATASLPQDTPPRERVWRFPLEPRPTATPEHIARLDRGYVTPRFRKTSRQEARGYRIAGWPLRDVALAGFLMMMASAVSGTVMYDRMENGAVLAAAKLWLTQADTPVAQRPSSSASAKAELPKAAGQTAAARKVQPLKTETVLRPALPAEPTTRRSKPIVTAGISVEDIVGEPNSMVPLPLRADAGTPVQSLALRLSGLPESSYLTVGNRVGKDGWHLSLKDAERAKLALPQAPGSSFSIDVAAIEAATGEFVSPFVEMNVAVTGGKAAVIVPAGSLNRTVTNFNTGSLGNEAKDIVTLNAHNAAQNVPLPLEVRSPTVVEAAKLIQHGNSVLDTGDIFAARAFYAKALTLGADEAAYGLGQTYDPAVFIAKKVQGLEPDAGLALRYYQQAANAGVAEAKTALSELQAKLSR